MKIVYIDGPDLAPENVTGDKYLNAEYFSGPAECDEVILCGDLPDIEKAYSEIKAVKIKKVESRKQKAEKAAEKAEADAEAKRLADEKAAQDAAKTKA